MSDTFRKRTTIGAAVFVFVLVLGYSVFQSRFLIAGPELSIETPTNGTTGGAPFTTVSGTAKNVNSITLNDRPIFIDENGYFAEPLLLARGYTIITIRAEDRFGRTETRELELVYKE